MKKGKIYLDANELYGYFINAIRAVKHLDHKDMPENIRKLKKRHDCIFITSVITKSEIRRRLRHENPDFEEMKFNNIFNKLWDDLLRLLEIQMVTEITINEKFDNLLNGKIFKCNLIDLIHIYIAKELGAKIYTNDIKMKKAIDQLYI